MAVFADVVVGIPYGDGTKKRWVKIGAVIQAQNNDASRGPGYIIMLDRHINLAGLPVGSKDGTSVACSTFWPDEKRGTHPPAATRPQLRRPDLPDPDPFNGDDDIPF